MKPVKAWAVVRANGAMYMINSPWGSERDLVLRKSKSEIGLLDAGERIARVLITEID